MTQVVAALERQGLTVWWDQRIEERQWNTQIEENLAAANRVIALISQNAIESKKYYIIAEMDRAFNDNKLIPIQIGKFTQPLSFAGLTMGQQTYFFDRFDQLVADERFSVICNLCRTSAPVAETVPQSAQRWIDRGPSLDELALGFSIAAIETAPLSVVSETAQLLEQNLKSALGEGAEETAKKGGLSEVLKSRTSRMRAVGAVTYLTRHGRYDVEVDCVRFEDTRRSFDLLTHFWDELDLLREPVVNWLDQLAKTASTQVRLRLGLMIGALARDRFMPIFESLISRWALQDSQRARDVADVALSVVAMDRRLKSTVARVIKDWVHSSDRTRLRAAVEIACGYTGFQFETLSVDILKAAARSRVADAKIFDIMAASIDFLLTESRESDDNSLLNIGRLFEGLADWVEKPEPGTPPVLPLYLFLRLMNYVPLLRDKRVYGRFSLEALVEDDLCFSTARMFGKALQQFGDEGFSPRTEAQRILRAFIEEMLTERAKHTSASIPDPLLILVREIYRQADGERDRERLVFAVRRLYAREIIEAAEPMLPVLSLQV